MSGGVGGEGRMISCLPYPDRAGQEDLKGALFIKAIDVAFIGRVADRSPKDVGAKSCKSRPTRSAERDGMIDILEVVS